MKILQIIHKVQNRGAETFACQMANHFQQLGHSVKVVSIYNGEANLPFNDEIISLGGSPNQRFFDVSSWKKLAKIINSFEPDIVQANSGDSLKYAVFSKILFKWKSPLISRNASEVGKYLNSGIQKALNQFLYRFVEGVISVSKASANDLLAHFPFLKGKTKIIGVGLEQEEVKEKVNFTPLKNKHVAHVGGFTFEKNHVGLLNIFQKIAENHPAVHLHLIGDGPLRKKIETKVKEIGLEEKISFYGFVDNPLAYIKGADVLVLPSIIEGLPGVLLEAMYCKTPVIAYDVGGISEIITSHTGILVPKNDEESFAKSTLQILEDIPKQKIETAFNMVNENFLNQRLAIEFIKAYEAV